MPKAPRKTLCLPLYPLPRLTATKHTEQNTLRKRTQYLYTPFIVKSPQKLQRSQKHRQRNTSAAPLPNLRPQRHSPPPFPTPPTYTSLRTTPSPSSLIIILARFQL